MSGDDVDPRLTEAMELAGAAILAIQRSYLEKTGKRMQTEQLIRELVRAVERARPAPPRPARAVAPRPKDWPAWRRWPE